MDIFASSSEYAHWPVEADVDLAGATFEVYLEGEWQETTWAAAAVHTGSTWTRTARLRVAGPGGTPGLELTDDAPAPLYRIDTGDGGERIVRRSLNSIRLTP